MRRVLLMPCRRKSWGCKLLIEQRRMKDLNKLFLVIFLMAFMGQGLSQTYGGRNFVTRQGYLIYVGWTWFFQPSSNRTGPIQSLNKTSFRIDLGTDGFNNSIAIYNDSLIHFDSIVVDSKWHRDSTYYRGDVLYYAYGEMEYGNTDKTYENMNPCLYKIRFLGKEYSIGCAWFHPEVNSFKRL